MSREQSGGGRPLALVTGASSGIGQAYAEWLAAEGYDLVVIARRAERLEELKQKLEAAHSVSVRVLAADLASEAGQREVEAAASDPRIAMVVDSAALAHYMRFVDLPVEKADELVKLNVLAPVRMIRAALPGMVKRGRGSVVSVASQLAFSATADNPQFPQRAIYASTKAFLVTFIRLLALELRESGVRVQVVCPGLVRSEFHTRQGMDMSQRPRMEPHEVVQASMAGLEQGEIVCIPTLAEGERVERHAAAEIAVLMGGTGTDLAPRYRGGADAASDTGSREGR